MWIIDEFSILFDRRLTLWEHQSTLNRNMPLRGLLYYSRNIEGLFDSRQKRKLYLKLLVKIPAPEYYVFYNGTEDAPEREDGKSDDEIRERLKKYYGLADSELGKFLENEA